MLVQHLVLHVRTKNNLQKRSRHRAINITLQYTCFHCILCYICLGYWLQTQYKGFTYPGPVQESQCHSCQDKWVILCYAYPMIKGCTHYMPQKGINRSRGYQGTQYFCAYPVWKQSSKYCLIRSFFMLPNKIPSAFFFCSYDREQ